MRHVAVFSILALVFLLGMTLVNANRSGFPTFLSLVDTPKTYVGQASKLLRVNAGETGLEFFTASGIVDTNCDSNPACHLLSSTIIWDNNAVLDGRYLPLTGGTLTGPLDVNANSANALLVQKSDGTTIFNVNTNGARIQTPSIRPAADLTYDIGVATTLRYVNAFVQNYGSLTDPASKLFVSNGTITHGLFKDLNVDDANISINDLNDSQSCGAGLSLTSVGKVTACGTSGGGTDSNKVGASSTDTTPDFLNKKLVSGAYTNLTLLNPGSNETLQVNAATADNNTSVTLTGKITTTQDINAQNGKFRGTLSADDFNFTITDANTQINCGSKQFFSSIGPISTCKLPSNLDLNWDYLASSGIIPWQDVNIASSTKWNADANWQQIGAIFPLGDGNISSATTWNNKLNWSQVSPLFPVPDANILNAGLYLRQCDHNNQCILTGTLNSTTDGNVLDLNTMDVNAHGQLRLDENIIGNDANTSDIYTNANGGHYIYMTRYNCKAGALDSCLLIPVNTYAFTTADGQGMKFDNVTKNISIDTSYSKMHAWYIGAANSGMFFHIPRSTDPTVATGVFAGSMYVKTFVDSNRLMMLQTKPDGNVFIEANTFGSDLNISNDVNVGHKFNISTSQSNACAGMAKLSSGTVTVSTNCVTASSLIFLTVDTPGTAAVTATYVSARTAGTSFVISSIGVLDDQNIAWMIIEPK